MLSLAKVEQRQEDILHNLMQFYIYDFIFFKPEIQLELDGTYKRFELSEYWTCEHRHAYFIKMGEELIGFALVATTTPHSIEEFHIIRKYTGRGFGKVAAHRLFAMFPGSWQVTQIKANEPAKAFWRKVIGEYTNGNYTEHTDQHSRIIQEFTSVHISA